MPGPRPRARKYDPAVDSPSAIAKNVAKKVTNTVAGPLSYVTTRRYFDERAGRQAGQRADTMRLARQIPDSAVDMNDVNSPVTRLKRNAIQAKVTQERLNRRYVGQ